MTPCFHLALIFLIFNSVLADSDLFSNEGDFTASLFTDYQEAVPGDDSLLNTNPDIFASLPGEEDWNTDLLSSCATDENGQLILRGRAEADVCKPGMPGSSTFKNPTLPTYLDIENAVQGKPNGPEKKRPTGPFVIMDVEGNKELGANEPEYYCNLDITPLFPPVPFSIPLCCATGPGDRQGQRGYNYQRVYGCRVRKFVRHQARPGRSQSTEKCSSLPHGRLGMP